MKLYPFAATALLFASGSAFAYAPSPAMKADLKAAVDQGATLAALKAPADKAAKAMPVAFFTDGKPLLVPAATVTWEKDDATAGGDPDLDLAETSIDDSVPAEPAVSDPADTQPAMGGPFEEVAAADLTQHAATQNYPACRPGPGDDNCIQLYEPGVRTALARWTAPTGGLSDGTQVAMGGPEEPVAEALAMNGDGAIDEASGETEDLAAI